VTIPSTASIDLLPVATCGVVLSITACGKRQLRFRYHQDHGPMEMQCLYFV